MIFHTSSYALYLWYNNLEVKDYEIPPLTVCTANNEEASAPLWALSEVC